MNARTSLSRAAFAAVALALASQCGPAAAQDAVQDITSKSVVETIKKRGVMRIGVSTFVPWAMRDKKGELVGFEIDVAKKVAEDMGVKVEFVPTAWDGIIPALIAGKFDVIISGMSIRPSRNLTVNFTAPYAHAGLQIAASKKAAANWKLEQFNGASVKIACRRGSTACSEGMTLFPKAQFLQFDDDAQSFQETINGNAHAVLSSAPKPQFWTIQQPDALYRPTLENLTTTNEAFALRKGDPDAVNFFNNWILTRSTDGWLKERHHYWFNTMDWRDQVEIKQ
jgi:polar amino acid transport system substrate-binding protein